MEDLTQDVDLRIEHLSGFHSGFKLYDNCSECYKIKLKQRENMASRMNREDLGTSIREGVRQDIINNPNPLN